MSDARLQRGCLGVGRQCNGKNGVVKGQIRRRRRSDRPTFGVDQHVVGFDADLLEHRTQQRDVVFTIAIAMAEYFGGGMGLVPADTQFDGDVADVVLHEARQRLHFSQYRGNGGGQVSDLLLDLRRRIAAAARETEIPGAELAPALNARILPAGGYQGDDHAAVNSPPLGHVLFDAYRANITYRPMPLARRPVRGVFFGVIEPVRLVRPAPRQLHGVTSRAHGNRVLEVPFVDHDVGPQLLFHFVAEDAARGSSRNTHRLRAQITHQLAAVHTDDRGFDGVLLLDLVILTGDRNAPGMHIDKAALCVEIFAYGAPRLAVRPQDPDHLAIQLLDLAVGLNGQRCFGIEHDGRRLLIMRREGAVELRAHPRRGVARPRRLRTECP